MAQHLSHESEQQQVQGMTEAAKKIWKVALILGVITSIEFVLAYVWPESISRSILNVLFIVLTLAKAFYIVAEFMHLRHEVKTLIMVVILPLLFLVWLLVALVQEGSAIVEAWSTLWK